MTSAPQVRDGRDDSAGRLPLGADTVARSLRRPSLAPATVSVLAALIDAVALVMGFWFAAYAAFGATGRAFDPIHEAQGAVLFATLVVLLAAALGLYELGRLRRFWHGAAVLGCLGLGVAVLEVGATPAVLAVALLLLPARALGAAMAAAAIDFGLTERRAVIVGGGERAESVIAGLARTPGNDIRICGLFDDRDEGRSPSVVAGIPKLGSTETLLDFARAAEIDMVIVTLPLTAEQRIRSILKRIEVLPLDVRLSDFSTDPGFRRRGGSGSGGNFVDLLSRPIRGGRLVLKRLIDLVGATGALILAAPLLLLTALAIRLDSPGPILFRQVRHGYNHRPITVWKFRSMYVKDCDPTARQVVTKGDPRVTRVGRFIRRTSIDELPQLFNVLAGDLSLVGPRPHALAAVSSRQEAFEAIVENYAARHKVRPGITGWAQVHGWRGEIDDPEALRRRVEHDLYYIENWSIWLDLKVLLITPFKLLDTRNAY